MYFLLYKSKTYSGKKHEKRTTEMSVEMISSEIKSLKTFQKVLQGSEWDAQCYCLLSFSFSLPSSFKIPSQ